MKKVGILSLCMLLFFMGNIQIVRADVIWEPRSDFYWDNAEECDFVGEYYLTDGKEGYVTLYKEPGSSEETGRIENGKRFYVGFSYTDKTGEVWAVLELWKYESQKGEWIAEDATEGWTQMTELKERYNEADFRKEYAASFQTYADEMASYEIKEAIYLWEYPGSDMMMGKIRSYMQSEDVPAYEYIYTDPDGRRWSYIGYYYGQSGWVCIDEPESKNIETSYELTEDFAQAQDTKIKQKMIRIAIVSVAGLVLVTVILIAALFRKKK